jgi:hypothetical protein
MVRKLVAVTGNILSGLFRLENHTSGSHRWGILDLTHTQCIKFQVCQVEEAQNRHR